MIWWVVGAAAIAAASVGGRKLMQRRLRKARDDHSRRPALWNRFYALDWGETTTNNYGFAPAEGTHPQRFQRQMYLELLRRLKAKRAVTPGMRLLEVSCGRGGGLEAIVEAEPELDVTALDVADSAVAFCRKRYGETDHRRFVAGSAMDLPFPDASFDVVLNVEASNDYPDRPRFFAEVARVLKPDGVFLYTDTARQRDVERMSTELAAAGFTTDFDEITQNVVEACRLDTPRRLGVIARAPMLSKIALGRQLRNYAAVEGSNKFESFRTGRRRYFMTAATRA